MTQGGGRVAISWRVVRGSGASLAPSAPALHPRPSLARTLPIFRAFLPGGDSFLDTYGRRPPGEQEAFYIKSTRIGIDRGRPDRVYADDDPARPPSMAPSNALAFPLSLCKGLAWE
ncbi:unnamed protein product, partial [Iphiclides podalirius]